LFEWCVRLSWLLVGFRAHLKSLHLLDVPVNFVMIALSMVKNQDIGYVKMLSIDSIDLSHCLNATVEPPAELALKS